MNVEIGLLVCGAERNQGAVVNCRFDPTLRNRGLTLGGHSRWVRVNPHRFCCSLAWVFTRPRSPRVGLDRRGFDAHAADDFGLGVVSIPAAFGCLTLARKYEGGLFAHAELMQQVVQNPHSDR